MHEKGYAQNPSKRVIAPELRSAVENRKLQELVTSGEVAAATRHLGGQYCRTGSNGEEIKKRLAQISAVWCEFGGFWTSDAPFAAKRMAFIGSVQGAALSGLTSYVLTTAEKGKLDTKLVRMLRCMMRGRAYNKEKHECMTNGAVYAH